MKQKLLISKCLLGEQVKYDGKDNKLCENVLLKLRKNYILYPVCPEVDGGLTVPRVPCEIKSYNPLLVINKMSEDKTKEFLKGAKVSLQVCIDENIKLALFKSNSPSCSNKYVYDGLFQSKKIEQKGVTVKLLEKENITVYNEKEIKKLL